MSADELFVLVLVIGCVIAVVAAAVHSRRQHRVAGDERQPASEPTHGPAPTTSASNGAGQRVEATTADDVPASSTDRKKGRRRR